MFRGVVGELRLGQPERFVLQDRAHEVGEFVRNLQRVSSNRVASCSRQRSISAPAALLIK